MAKTEPKEPVAATDSNTNQEQTTLAMQQEIDVLKAQKASQDKTILSLQQQLKEKEQSSQQHDVTVTKLQEQIDLLTRDKDALQHQLDNNAHVESDDKVDKLEEQLLNQKEEISQLNTTIDNLKQQLADEQEEHQAVTNHNKAMLNDAITLSPIAQQIVTAVAAALSFKYGRTITPRDVVSDYILRYNIQRWSQWFHPFVLSDKELLAIAQKENENIRSIQQLKNALGIKDKV